MKKILGCLILIIIIYGIFYLTKKQYDLTVKENLIIWLKVILSVLAVLVIMIIGMYAVYLIRDDDNF